MLTIMTTKKLITKQNLLLAFALTACFILSFYYEGFSIILGQLQFYFIFHLAIYLIRIKVETTRQSLSKNIQNCQLIAIILLFCIFLWDLWGLISVFQFRTRGDCLANPLVSYQILFLVGILYWRRLWFVGWSKRLNCISTLSCSSVCILLVKPDQ